MKFIGIYFMSCILWKEILAERPTISLEKPARTDYFDGFVNYLKDESKLYRVVFILEDQFESSDPMLNSLIKEVNQHFPSFSSSYNEIFIWRDRINAQNFGGRLNYRSSTLFVFEAKNNYTMNSIGYNLRKINSRSQSALSRCLIMNSFNSSHEYLNITLQSLWKYHLLDVTIMTYSQYNDWQPFLSHINPFTKTFTALEITPKIQWFPDKLKDLKGQKTDFYFKTTSIYDDREQEQWMNERTSQIFSKAMNSELSLKFPTYYKPHLTADLQNTFMEFDHSAILRIQKIDSLKAVIPKTEKMTKNIVFSPELLHLIMITIFMIVIILVAAFFLNFSKTVWQPLNMSQIIMGMPANQEPNNWLEKIVFGSLLITCIVYTGFFYSVILDISLQTVPEISTLEELADSSLRLKIDDHTYDQLVIYNFRPHIEKLLTKADDFKNEQLKGLHCLEYLASYKNISCILADAENLVNLYSSLKGEALNVKILPETLAYYFFLWENYNNPPFTDFYNKIIQRATEFGLFDKVYSINNVLPGKISPPEEIEKEKLFFIISYVLGFGFSISIISFLVELFIRNFSNRVYNLYASFGLGN